MAGWLKFEVNTPDKPEVFAITATMGWDDPDLTVGKLLKIWRWFDQQTVNGHAPCVTKALLDRICGANGFAQAMIAAGWLVVDAAGSYLPHFERHNGKTAKDRALTAVRVANYKSRGTGSAGAQAAAGAPANVRFGQHASGNASGNEPANASGNDSGNAPTVTAALPRKEKIRGEKKEPKKPKSEAGATRLPPDWQPGEKEIAFCKAKRPDLDPLDVAACFADYWMGLPGARARKIDWLATWRNWVRNARANGATGAPRAQDKFHFAGQDRSADEAAQAESMRRHRIDAGAGGEL